MEAAKQETDPSNYKTMWDHYKTRFGKECDGMYEESRMFGNFESNDEVFYATTPRVSRSCRVSTSPPIL